jgi:hypothetical protein
MKSALRIVRELFGLEPAAAFDPKKLKLVRQAMINQGWARPASIDTSLASGVCFAGQPTRNFFRPKFGMPWGPSRVSGLAARARGKPSPYNP